MDGNELNPSVKTQAGVGPEVATRRSAVSLGRKVLSDIVLGFSALTVIGVLKALQSLNQSIVLFGLETVTTATLSIWLVFLILSFVPNDLYERVNTIEKLSFKQIAIVFVGIVVWCATFIFVSTTVEGLGLITGS